MRIECDWISAKSTQAVCRALTSAGYQTFFVGGCVRNALLNEPVSDIDIATNARPEQTLHCAEMAGLKAIPTGIAHGTITLLSDGTPFEITTFRADTETDGRHATVRFSDDIAEDASRRDFTVNALYALPSGEVVDPLDGIGDLNSRRVRFIGDAETRIREDFLRILRFFRFFARYGAQDGGIDADGLAAVAANLEGLRGVSRERTTSEIIKLLSAKTPEQATSAMHSSGALNVVLPGAQVRALGPFIHFAQQLGLPVDPIARLTALGGDSSSLRLSRAQEMMHQRLTNEAGDLKSAAHLGYLFGKNVALNVIALRAAMTESPLPAQAKADSEKGEQAVFPISADDLMPALSGPALGQALKRLEGEWIKSGFRLSRDDLLG